MLESKGNVPYVIGVELNPDRALDPGEHPGNLPFVKDLRRDFTSRVTFFVGENGSGKSTLLEAMAVLAGLSRTGGGTNEAGESHDHEQPNLLARSLWMAFRKRPKDRYFFRAEAQLHFASLLEARRADPDFRGDPYSRYGGKSLHQMSHGEAFLSVMQNRFDKGLFFLDEPESALSPQRQLTLLALMYKMASSGKSQFFVATHSPILLTFPGAEILSFDHGNLETVALEDTSHFQITRDLLNNPPLYWRHLAVDED